MPLPSSTQPLRRTLMRDEVYEILLDLIVDQKLQPGEKLADKELASQLGVSRTPVRESIRRLEEEGFVVTAANRWTRVASIDTHQADDLYPIIRELESLALPSSMLDLDEQHFLRMQRINERLSKAIDRGHARLAVQLDTELHAVLIGACSNPEILSILRRLKLKMQRIEQSFFDHRIAASDSATEHSELIRALRSGDQELARARLREHWDQSLQRLHAAATELERAP